MLVDLRGESWEQREQIFTPNLNMSSANVVVLRFASALDVVGPPGREQNEN